jgi:hypothetical protein
VLHDLEKFILLVMESLYAWYDEVNAHIQKSGLINLSEHGVNDINLFATFTDVTRSKAAVKSFSYSDFKHGDELNYLSMDFIYAISIIELLHPRINNAVKENGTYHQTAEDHLYLRYASYGLQILYAYWDRIGDFLDLFFATKQKGDVYLANIFRDFPAAYQSATFDELVDLYKTKVKPVLGERHATVHTFTLKAKYYWGVIEHGGKDQKKVEELQAEKDAYPALFREQLEYMFKGFELALKLVSELPDATNSAEQAQAAS